jgi:hypothetical protein
MPSELMGGTGYKRERESGIGLMTRWFHVFGHRRAWGERSGEDKISSSLSLVDRFERGNG